MAEQPPQINLIPPVQAPQPQVAPPPAVIQKKEGFLSRLFSNKDKITAKDVKDSYTPIFKIKFVTDIPNLPEPKDLTQIDVRYKVIEPYVSIHIHWDPATSEVLYDVEEPILSGDQKKDLKLIEDGLTELINMSYINIEDMSIVIEFLEKNLRILLDEFGIKADQETFLKYMYFIYRDFVGMGQIEPLLKDYFIEDIECNGFGTPIYIVHRKYRNLMTSVIYPEMKALTSFVEKLAQKCSKYVSYANPLLDGVLPDGSLDYNEQFIYKQDGIAHVSKMGEFIDKFYTGNDSNKPVKVRNIEVPSFDKKTLKISWKNVDYVYRHRINEQLYKLELETGRNVTLTGAHSIFALRKEGVKAEKTESLQEGEYVAMPISIPINDVIKEINLAEEISKTQYAKKIVISNVPRILFEKKKDEIKEFLRRNYKHLYSAYYEHKKKQILPVALHHLLSEEELRKCKLKPTSAVAMPTFIKVSKELMRFLGYYIAEGWPSSTQNAYYIQFSLNKKEYDIIEDIKNSARECFGLSTYVEPPVRNGVKVKVNSFILWVLFKEVLRIKKGAHEKEVPDIVYNVSRELQKEFINAWWAGDYGYTVSDKLISDVLYLHLFDNKVISFQSRLKESEFEGCRPVSSMVNYTQRLMEKPQLDYPYMIPVEVFNPLNKTSHTLKANARISRERLRKLLRDARYARLQNMNELHPIQFGIEWQNRGIIKGQELTEIGKEVIKELRTVNKLLDSDLGFVKIKNISRVNPTKEFVYDVSVSDCENFIGGVGGICCHNSRVNATYTEDITSRGPTFTVRKFTKEPWTPIKLMDFKTVSPEILAYLWIAIENKSNVLVIGGTGSGKTSFLNAIAFFIPPAARVVSIEDTRELNLKHENWLPAVSRAGMGSTTITGEHHGEVSLFDLLKESLRQRPDYIIVGEIRGKEAFVLFQGMSTGHPSFGTMHAESVDTVVKRLIMPPIELSPSMVEALDIACIITPAKVNDKEVRRVREISEIVSVNEKGESVINTPFIRDPAKDVFLFKTGSKVFEKIMKRTGMPWEKILREFRLRAKLLMEMYKRKIFGFAEVQEIINQYYKVPQEVIKKFGLE